MRLMTTLMMMLGLLAPLAQAEAPAARIKDIASIEGVRENILIGYGLVVGLAGSGDSVPYKARPSVTEVEYGLVAYRYPVHW